MTQPLAPSQLGLPVAPPAPGDRFQEIRAEGLRLRWWRGWLPPSAGWMERLIEGIPWQQPCITVFGRRGPIPRLSCWVADPGCTYAYSGSDQPLQIWTPQLLELRHRLDRQLEQPPGRGFNGVLLNLYRDGRDSMGWHADDEPELDAAAPIASLSLGASRTFRLRPRDGHRPPLDLQLGDGDLLVMDPPTQRHWLHALPRRLKVAEPRLNLTFRRLNPGG